MSITTSQAVAGPDLEVCVGASAQSRSRVRWSRAPLSRYEGFPRCYRSVETPSWVDREVAVT